LGVISGRIRLRRGGRGTLPAPSKAAKKFQEVETAKKSMEKHVFCQGLSYAVLTGHGLTESEGMWGRFRGWLRTVDFHRFLPKLKRLKVFGNIIESI
jgi:hypothetical protein